MITELTPEQEAKIPEYMEKWLAIGLSTERVDMATAVPAVIKAYECADLPPPAVENILFARSPVEAGRMLKERNPDGNVLESCIFGCHEASWLSFYSYFKEVLKLDNLEKIEGLIEVAHTCGWVNVYEDFAIIQDRPSVIKFDDQERLHSEIGPAIEYVDDFAVHAWHGTRIPKSFLDGTLTAAGALKEENMELRRCACEIKGWINILDELDAVEIEQDEDEMIGTLRKVRLPDFEEDEYFLKVLCGTGRYFALPVPPTMTTALEANAWTYGMEPGEYAPEFRT